MSLGAIGLLFGSAILHTAWNLMLKQAGEKYMATWWGMLVGSLLFMPALFFLGLPARSTWLLLAISALMGAGYFIVLSFAYDDADFSLVYPMARGAAPALIAAWSVLFLSEKLSEGGVTGIVVIVLGLVIVGSSGWFGSGAIPALRDPRGLLRGIWPALLMAVIISVYSVIDGAAVKRTEPISYAGLVYFVSSIYMTPYVLKKNGWTAMKQEFAAYRWRLILTGALIVSSYLLALWAYQMSSVSYSGAIREVGVVMGAVVGWQFLGERSGALRVTGSVVIFAGILIIAIFG